MRYLIIILFMVGCSSCATPKVEVKEELYPHGVQQITPATDEQFERYLQDLKDRWSKEEEK